LQSQHRYTSPVHCGQSAVVVIFNISSRRVYRTQCSRHFQKKVINNINLNTHTKEMTTATMKVRLNVMVYIARSILTLYTGISLGYAARTMLCYADDHNKASNADDKVLSNSTSGVDIDIGIAPFVVPGAGKKCFASCCCSAADSYKTYI
jgi:hypothetical protein